MGRDVPSTSGLEHHAGGNELERSEEQSGHFKRRPAEPGEQFGERPMEVEPVGMGVGELVREEEQAGDRQADGSSKGGVADRAVERGVLASDHSDVLERDPNRPDDPAREVSEADHKEAERSSRGEDVPSVQDRSVSQSP